MEDVFQAHSSDSDDAYYRVPVSIPIRISPLPDDDVLGRAAEVLSRVDVPVPELDPALVAWLDRIERKLDRLLHRESLSDGLSSGVLERGDLNLSATGIQLEVANPHAAGTAMLVEFELPEVPTRRVSCIGRVLPADTDTDIDQLVDIAFETIRQSDLDSVVRYTLVVQRQMIIGKANATGPTV